MLLFKIKSSCFLAISFAIASANYSLFTINYSLAKRRPLKIGSVCNLKNNVKTGVKVDVNIVLIPLKSGQFVILQLLIEL